MNQIMQEHYEKSWDYYVDKPMPTAVEVCNKAIEIALAEANAAQQFQRKKLDCYLWEFLNENGEYQHCFSAHDGIASEPLWLPHKTYRCTPKPTCQVRNDDNGELKTMTREAAKKLQAETMTTHDWFFDNGTQGDGLIFGFDSQFTGNPYTYKLKGTVKLAIDNEPAKMLTPAQCEAERLARVDTHDVECSTKRLPKSKVLNSLPKWQKFDAEFECQYKLIRKQPKQVSWKDVPAGVAVTCPLLINTRIFMGVNPFNLTGAHLFSNQYGHDHVNLSTLSLAPASDQPWIPVVALSEGLAVEYSRFHECLRITGLAEDWVLK